MQIKETHTYKCIFNNCPKCGHRICWSESSLIPGTIVQGECINVRSWNYSKLNNGCIYKCFVERQENGSVCFLHHPRDMMDVQLDLFK